MKEYTLTVNGIMCPKCEQRIITALKEIKGVKTATASHENGIVTVVAKSTCKEQAISCAVKNLGYEVVSITTAETTKKSIFSAFKK